jgi:hypothetical protein
MGAVVAVLVIKKEREIVDAFRRAGATSAARARSLDDVGLDDNRMVDRLRSRAVLREGSPGLLYLDEPSWFALQRIRRRAALVMLSVIVFVVLLAVSARWVG